MVVQVNNVTWIEVYTRYEQAFLGSLFQILYSVSIVFVINNSRI